MKKTKKKVVKAWALWSHWGLHRAYTMKTLADMEIQEGKKGGLNYWVEPCTITYEI